MYQNHACCTNASNATAIFSNETATCGDILDSYKDSSCCYANLSKPAVMVLPTAEPTSAPSAEPTSAPSDEPTSQPTPQGTMYGDGIYDSCGTQVSTCQYADRRSSESSPISQNFVKKQMSSDTKRMQNLVLSIVDEPGLDACVPKSVQHVPTVIIGGNAKIESYVRSACFENIESVPSTENCMLSDDTQQRDLYTVICGSHQVSINSTSTFDTLKTLQVAIAHMNAIKAAFDAGHEQVLILESDADMALVPHWGNAGLDAALDSIPEDYHILRLFEFNRDVSEMNSDKVARPFSIDRVHRTPIGLQPVWGAVAYMVSRSGMRYLLDRWRVTDTSMQFLNNDDWSFCRRYMYTSECLLFMGPKVFQSTRSLFGHQMSPETRRGSERKGDHEELDWMNEASSIDILSSYNMTQAVPIWHRSTIFPQSVLPIPEGTCCDWPTDESACGVTELGESMCIAPASAWCSLSKENCQQCKAMWCDDRPSSPPPNPQPLPLQSSIDEESVSLLSTARYAEMHSTFPIAVMYRDCEPDLLQSTLHSLLKVRGVSANSVTVVRTSAELCLVQTCDDIAGIVGVKVADSLEAFEQQLSAPALVVAENGLSFSPDAMEFFLAAAPAVEHDPTLWTASASNPNARPCHIGDNLKVQRTSAFPGLAWLLMRTIWEGHSGSLQGEPPLEWRRGREALFPEVPRVSNLNSIHNQDAALRWPSSIKLSHEMLLSNYEANLQGRILQSKNVTHVSRVGEVPLEAAYQVVLWYEQEQGEQATDLARHFGLWKDDIMQGAHYGVHDLVWHGTRVLLVNSLDSGLSQELLPSKPLHLEVLSATEAAASKLPSAPCDVKQCRWTMIAGDSNLRHITENWMGSMTMQKEGIARNAQREGKYLNAECEDRWAGNEWVMSNEEECHIITQRFMTSQDGISQLLADVHDSSYCGTRLVDPLRADERRPTLPDVIWFGHGLWDLPLSGASVPDSTCDDRFGKIVAGLQHWQAGGTTKVVWQTNFRIKGHRTITNEYLKWDIGCQRQVAQEHGIALFDAASLFEEMQQVFDGSESVSGGYHMNSEMALEIASVLDATVQQQADQSQSELQAHLSKELRRIIEVEDQPN